MEKELGFNLPIYQDRLSAEQLSYFLEVTDKMLEGEGMSELDASESLVGEIHEGHQFKINRALWRDFDGELRPMIEKYVLELSAEKYRVEKTIFIAAWMVSQRAGDYNPLHTHAGTVSGILYLKASEDMFQADTVDGLLNFSFGHYSPQALHFMGMRKVRPAAGDLYLFPSWLAHSVYPFKGTAERRSISFNYQVDVAPITT